ncbi:hypothetical protein G6L99_31550 [Agrobacterium rhizogenes]|nr:hypothetical protein [Rhizobium rhizogenes]
MPSDQWRKLWPNPFTSMAIPVGGGREYPCTQAGVDAAHRLTAQTWQARADLRQTISRETFNRLSFTAVGQALASSPAHIPPDAPSGPADDAFFIAVAADYAANLDVLATGARPTVDRHIPCHLFHPEQKVAAFSVGPVTFRARADWIADYVKDPLVLDHVQQVDQRILPITDLRQRAYDDGATPDLRVALSILTFLGGYSWFGTIRMQNHEATQSHDKASVIVGLAIDLVGLRFHVDDARRFTKVGWRHLFGEVRQATDVNGGFLQGMKAELPGLGDRPGALAAKMTAEQPFLDAAGEVLKAYVTARNSGQAPHLIERWANALYWFGEARREASDFMAVVDYGCAADGLSGAGGNIKPMKEFADAALNSKGLNPNPQAVADVVNRIYSEGRNKLAHGEVPGLFEDQAEARKLGDVLLSGLLNEVTPALAEVMKTRGDFLKISTEHAYRAFISFLKNRP